MGQIFYVMGKSASGKDTLYQRLLDDMALETVCLYTTRPMRAGETEGVEYHFTDHAAFESLKAAGRVIEARTYQTVCGPWTYFTVDDGQVCLDRHHYLLLGTLESYLCVRRYYGEAQVVPLYMEVESGERLARALARERGQTQPNYAEMCRRFLADEADFSEEKLAAAGIEKRFVNEDADACLFALETYLAAHQVARRAQKK